VTVVEELAPQVGAKPVCDALGLSKATLYRRRKPAPKPPSRPSRPRPARSLSEQERSEILALANEDRFADKSLAQVHAILLDEGRYLGSLRTWYRVLGQQGQVRERRNQLRHPNYTKPELLATGPNQVWSWDITKLRGPRKGEHYSLYVVLDIFSRYVVGWTLSPCESGEIAQHLFRETLQAQRVQKGQVTVHADRGAPMKSKALGFLLADLDVVKSHSRPRISNDNPFSESQFKTLKYRPDFPDRFGSIQDARAFCRHFFRWYNAEHRHSGIAMLTPEQVHLGKAAAVVTKRQGVLDAAFRAHPERFVRGRPRVPQVPAETWINKPDLEGAVL